MRTVAHLTRFEVFSHKRVMAKVQCQASKSQTCVPMAADPCCLACEEADYQASQAARAGEDFGEQLPRWYTLALADIGVSETPGAAATQRIAEYHRHTSLKATSDEVPWCAAAMNCWLEEAGIPGTGSAAARSFLRWGQAIDTPVEGCIVILKRGTNPAQGHVGMYAGEKPRLIRLLAGNQGNKVCYAWFSKTDVLGYRMPE